FESPRRHHLFNDLPGQSVVGTALSSGAPITLSTGDAAFHGTRHGPMLAPRGDRYVGRSLELYGEFSPAESRVFEQLVKPGRPSPWGRAGPTPGRPPSRWPAAARRACSTPSSRSSDSSSCCARTWP